MIARYPKLIIIAVGKAEFGDLHISDAINGRNTECMAIVIVWIWFTAVNFKE
jgi:hypothetical protein